MMPDAGHNFKFGIQLDVYWAGAFVALQKVANQLNRIAICAVE